MAAEAPDASWNRQVRGESEAERQDRNLAELLQELRVTLNGSQILFAFLLIVPFDSSFRHAGWLTHEVYLATMVISALSAGLLVSPAAMHRVLFRQHAKSQLLAVATSVALAGQALFALAITGAAFLVGDYIEGMSVGLAIGSLVLVWYATWFFVVPLQLRRAGAARRRRG